MDIERTPRRESEMTATSTRRTILRNAGMLCLLADPTGLVSQSHHMLAVPSDRSGALPRLWSDAGGWPGGRVPGPEDRVVIDDSVVLDRDARVAGMEIRAGGTLTFSPVQQLTLESSGNVVVAGALTMRPLTAVGRHVLRFVDVDEASFVGGGMRVLESDVGLWVVDEGRLDAVGPRRTPWTRLAGSAAIGDREVVLDGSPDGWRPGDLLVIAPSAPCTDRDFARSAEEVVVVDVVGGRVVLDRPLAHAHPLIDGVRGAEVLNLSREVRIEGTPDRRAHVSFLMVARPQHVEEVALLNLGPRRQRSNGHQEGVTGRYPLHFHHCGDGSRGTVVRNVVVARAGNHAFVPHASHGISMEGCVAHDVVEDAFWWDPRPASRELINDSDDTVWSGCVASSVQPAVSFRGYRLAGFNLGPGRRNRVQDCVAFGVQGREGAAGFVWDEKAGGDEPWTSTGLIAHNNARNGLFVWHNGGHPTSVSDVVSANNGNAGIEHGAYLSAYRYADVWLVGNAKHGALIHTNGSGSGQELANVVVDGRGITRDGITLARPRLQANAHTRVDGLTVLDVTGVAIRVTDDGKGHPRVVDIVGAELPAPRFHFSDAVPAETEIRVTPVDGAPYTALPRRAGRGKPAPEWNGRIIE